MSRTRKLARCLDHVQHADGFTATNCPSPARIIIPSDEVLQAEHHRPMHERAMILLALGTAAYFLGHGVVWLARWTI